MADTLTDMLFVFVIFIIGKPSQPAFIPYTEKSTVSPSLLCPGACVCDSVLMLASCSSYYKGFSLDSLSKEYTLRHLTLFGGLTTVPHEIQTLTGLRELDLSRNTIRMLSVLKLGNPSTLRELDMSSNDIVSVSQNAFQKLVNLEFLSLSENKIEQFSTESFKSLKKLRKLNLSYNRLYNLPMELFDSLSELEELDLGSNDLHWIGRGLFSNLHHLNSLHINDNQISTLTEDALYELKAVNFLSMFGNPWDCSYDIKPFLTFLKNHKEAVVSIELLHCAHPFKVQGMKVISLNNSDLHTENPIIYKISGSQEVTVQNNISIQCKSALHPYSIVYWVTPKGMRITHKFNQEILLSQHNITTYSKLQYKSGPFADDLSTLEISENNELMFKNFRGIFKGRYICIAINSYGNDTAYVELDLVSNLFSVQVYSIIVGVISAGMMLVLGAFVGIIKMCARHICKCECAQIKENRVTDIEDKDEDDANCDNLSQSLDESSVGNYSESLLKVPVNSPVGRTPRSSPKKCVTPTPGDSFERGRNISDTLDEVKIRLERKIDKVRTRGSQYLTTIKDTGSHAASKVKAGVAMGVEQVKSGYMSMKEFCGTGDMAQTISVVSVNTDIDSQEKTTEVVKVTTFV